MKISQSEAEDIGKDSAVEAQKVRYRSCDRGHPCILARAREQRRLICPNWARTSRRDVRRLVILDRLTVEAARKAHGVAHGA